MFAAEQLQAFHQVALQMLEDVQERLVYRANIYIRDDILGYKPSPGDLTYPEKLEMMQVGAGELSKIEKSIKLLHCLEKKVQCTSVL